MDWEQELPGWIGAAVIAGAFIVGISLLRYLFRQNEHPPVPFVCNIHESFFEEDGAMKSVERVFWTAPQPSPGNTMPAITSYQFFAEEDGGQSLHNDNWTGTERIIKPTAGFAVVVRITPHYEDGQDGPTTQYNFQTTEPPPEPVVEHPPVTGIGHEHLGYEP